jgi:hypothetical protein
MKHVSDQNAAKEIEVAVSFDLRDNPQARDFLDHLVQTKGIHGARDFTAAVLREIDAEYKGDRSVMMFPWTRAAVRTLIAGGMTYESVSNFGMGFLAALIGGVVSAAVQATGTIFSSKIVADSQVKIARIQTEAANKEADALKAAAEAAKAKAEAELKAAAGAPFGGAAAPGTVAGIGTGTIVTVGAVALGAVFLLPKLLGK